ncbi:hypothetical protein LEP1GSC188_3376 [Leptospira weilii serovar Topaz str. LT2116]|uniref:Uncharacterized protein n=1 Tax=Leptospira weilii serovar Topaz str. LT2116 TaxID=1088540 RepID=M3G836_9LEPT|nr:hypothetical protein LEP1GSC188_3376 [Leptospira weilii serovar Topaz str. LT2116]
MKRLILKLDIQDTELDNLAARAHAVFGSASIENIERFVKQALKTDSVKIIKEKAVSSSSSS